MDKLAPICCWIEHITEWSGKIVKFLLVPIAFVVFYEVISRYFFNQPTLWAWETEKLIFGTYLLLSGAYVLLINGHVSMDALYNRLSFRKRAILEIFTYVFFFTFIGVMVWKGSGYAWQSFVAKEISTSAWGAPYWLLKMAIPIGSILILLQGVAKLLRNLHIAVKNRDLT